MSPLESPVHSPHGQLPTQDWPVHVRIAPHRTPVGRNQSGRGPDAGRAIEQRKETQTKHMCSFGGGWWDQSIVSTRTRCRQGDPLFGGSVHGLEFLCGASSGVKGGPPRAPPRAPAAAGGGGVAYSA
eukprot:gene12569-biopygen22985